MPAQTELDRRGDQEQPRSLDQFSFGLLPLGLVNSGHSFRYRAEKLPGNGLCLLGKRREQDFPVALLPDQGNFFSQLKFPVRVGEIDQGLIHRDSSDKRE